jgi:hypothetical protein
MALLSSKSSPTKSRDPLLSCRFMYFGHWNFVGPSEGGLRRWLLTAFPHWPYQLVYVLFGITAQASCSPSFLTSQLQPPIIEFLSSITTLNPILYSVPKSFNRISVWRVRRPVNRKIPRLESSLIPRNPWTFLQISSNRPPKRPSSLPLRLVYNTRTAQFFFLPPCNPSSSIPVVHVSSILRVLFHCSLDQFTGSRAHSSRFCMFVGARGGSQRATR